MKTLFFASTLSLLTTLCFGQTTVKHLDTTAKKHNLYIDVHDLEPGKVSFDAVAAAHLKDLEQQKKYGVNFMKYWVDEEKGKVYCLSSAADPGAIEKTHAAAHGLLPASVYKVADGPEATEKGGKQYFLDIHELGEGKVTEKAVAEAHIQDMAVQEKYGVNFINYWVDTKKGWILCLSEAPNSKAVIDTHKEAHGLLPNHIHTVKQGQ